MFPWMHFNGAVPRSWHFTPKQSPTSINKSRQKAQLSAAARCASREITYLQSASAAAVRGVAHIHKDSSLSSRKPTQPTTVVRLLSIYWWDSLTRSEQFSQAMDLIFDDIGSHEIKVASVVPARLGFSPVFVPDCDANCALYRKLRPQNCAKHGRDLYKHTRPSGPELNWRDGLVLDKMCVPFMPGRMHMKPITNPSRCAPTTSAF